MCTREIERGNRRGCTRVYMYLPVAPLESEFLTTKGGGGRGGGGRIKVRGKNVRRMSGGMLD